MKQPSDTDNKSAFAVSLPDEVSEAISGKTGETLRKLEGNAPTLDDAEIRKIADKAAQDVIDNYLNTLPPEEKASWGKRLKQFGYDVCVGLVRSGIWAGIVYVVKDVFFADRTGADASAEKRLHTIQDKLAEGLSTQEKDEMAAVAPSLVHAATEDRLVTRVLHSETFQAFVAAIAEEDRRTGIKRYGYPIDRFAANVFVTELVSAAIKQTQDKIVPSTEVA